jgi:p24 family protein delta-1
MLRRHARPPLTPLSSLFFTFCLLLLVPLQTYAIKFNLIAQRYPAAKCIWNPAHTNTLVVVTANVLAGDFQKVDVEIMDSSPQKNVYMTKKNLNGESRLAITTHAEGEVGVCFKNTLDESTWHGSFLSSELLTTKTFFADAPDSKERSRVIDLDVDIGADAVDYK